MACANGGQYMTHVTWTTRGQTSSAGSSRELCRSWLPHPWLVCVFPDFAGLICTVFLVLFEHSLWSRCLLADRCPLWSAACGIFWSQVEIAQMSTQSPRVNTVSIQQTQQAQMTGLQTGHSRIFHGDSVYMQSVCVCVCGTSSACGFKWL